MTTTKPDWIPTPAYELDYEVIVKSWGWEVLSFDTIGFYQGDHLVLLADGERRGFVMIGYGSCTGCDALEAAQPYSSRWDEDKQDWTAVVELSDELRNSVHWEPSSSALAEWLESMLVSEGRGTDWYWFDGEAKTVTRRYVALLQEASRCLRGPLLRYRLSGGRSTRRRGVTPTTAASRSAATSRTRRNRPWTRGPRHGAGDAASVESGSSRLRVPTSTSGLTTTHTRGVRIRHLTAVGYLMYKPDRSPRGQHERVPSRLRQVRSEPARGLHDEPWLASYAASQGPSAARSEGSHPNYLTAVAAS